MIKIRPAKVKEAREVAKLTVELLKDHLQYGEMHKIKKNAVSIAEDWLRKIPRSSRALLLVAEVDGKIVGYIKAKIRKRPLVYSIKEWGEIVDIYVQKECRKMGIGKQLMEHVFSWLKKKKIKYVDLLVAPDNEVAKMLYKKYKFEEYWKKMYRKI